LTKRLFTPRWLNTPAGFFSLNGVYFNQLQNNWIRNNLWV